MTRHTSFRPSLTILESRRLPTVSAYPDVFREAIQQSYAAQADTGTNPVVFLGDSITFNWGTAARQAPGSASFSADFAGLGTANFGIVGDTTQNLLDRVEDGDLNGQPKVAVVMIGINDLYGGSTPAQAASGVASVVRAIEAESPATKILLLGVLPTDIKALNPEVRQLDTLISGLGNLLNVTYEDPGVQFENADGMAEPDLLMDSVHPDAAGYQLLAGAIDGAILDLLGDATPATGTSPTGGTRAAQPSTIAATTSPGLLYIPLNLGDDSPTVDASAETSGHARSFATELITVPVS